MSLHIGAAKDIPLNAAETLAINLNLQTPMKRFAFGAAAATMATWVIQPRLLFDEQGNAKPWIGTLSPQEVFDFGGQAAPIPWWAPALVIGGVFSTLV